MDDHDDLCEGQLAALTPTDCQCAQRATGQLVLVPGKTCDRHPKAHLEPDGECPACWIEEDAAYERSLDR